uniref:Mediator of RNA polymerase II transcription subunit 12-like protein n=1 Tax=Cacopsylla melanoneura TaxID=428564 RepID=A0A8D9FIE5_9HEMI
MMGFSYEKRLLKRPRLGPPDVYPQDPKQKEDELTTVNVKHGFSIMPKLSDEFGTARNCNVTASKIGSYFNAILNKKEELNTLPDTRTRRQNITPKDNFWPATARTKNAVEAWFKDLAGSKSLLMLSKKAPNFNKKEEIFLLLCEYQVPMLRATWFIKLSSAYTVAVSEAKIKKRQLPDPMLEWTGTMLKFLKEQLMKLQEYYQHSSSSSSSSVTTMNEEQKIALKQWQYCTQLTKYMYQEGLIERQELLQWIIDLLEKLKSFSLDDGILKLILPIALQYLDEFVQSELMSRRLAYLCCKKLAQLANNSEQQAATAPNSPAVNSNTTGLGVTTGTNTNSSPANNNTNNTNTATTLQSVNTSQNPLSEYLNCAHHRDIVLSLSAIIQAITLECPTALVWNSIGEGKSPSVLNGSPLDHLPCSPAQLPMPQRASSLHLKSQLKWGEDLIRQRSMAAEGRWSCDKWHQTSSGQTINKILSVLDALDRHSFERVDANNSLDTLYSKIFLPPGAKDNAQNDELPNKNDYTIHQDEAVVHILCEWAVSGLRFGEHRAIAVAKLLEKRQNEVSSGGQNNETENPGTDDKDSVTSMPAGLPVFQPLLMKFLDQDAPTDENKTTFTNLVHLFAELIRHEVFSHDAYMCTLISRGDLPSASTGGNTNTTHPASNKPADTQPMEEFDMKPSKIEPQEHRGMDDDSKIDDDLDKLLQHIKEEQQNSMDAPDSPKDVTGSLVGGIVLQGEQDSAGGDKTKQSRHQLYTKHFPIPQDESYYHDCNQRLVLLYGVGRERDNARHNVKKMTKELCKLFTKKFSLDVADGGKVKKHSRNEFNFDQQHLSFFDQHYMTWQCSLTVLEMVQAFALGNSNYLPVQEHVAFLFDVMELCLNIYNLIEVSIQILKELMEVESQLQSKGSTLVRSYVPSLVLYIVGVLRRYHASLLLSPEQTVSAFEGLCKVVKNVSNPGDCSSVERCVLSHLYDLYSSCSLLKSRPHGGEMFSNAYPKIKAALYAPLQPSSSHHAPYNPTFMTDVIASYRKGVKIESSWARQLLESSSNRYSFVCNSIIAVCSENTDIDHLNDIAILCSELTACCNILCSEWLGVLMTLCGSSSNPASYFPDVLARVDIRDLSIHNALGVFTCILVARHCISLEDFVVKVALPSTLTVCRGAGRRSEADLIAEAGARLTCHLLLRLFKTTETPQTSSFSVGTSPHSAPSSGHSPSSIRLGCDRHLLTAAHNNIRVGPVLAVLKAIIVVGDATANYPPPVKKSPSSLQNTPSNPPKLPGELSISHILGTTDMSASNDLLLMDLVSGGSGSMETSTPGLSEFASLVLREICSQEWVLDRCLGTPEELFREGMLLDDMLSPKQAQRLLHMICYPERAANMDPNTMDYKTIIIHVLENLDQWTLRMSWLDMQLMYQQFASMANKGNSSVELNQWLDTVAKAVVDIFQVHPNVKPSEKGKIKAESMWLVAPLISKLPSAVQGRVLKAAGQVLENCNLVGCSSTGSGSSSSSGGGGGTSSSRGSKGTPQHSNNTPAPKTTNSNSAQLTYHQPFLSLVLTCLKEQDDQREGLLSSLHSQLSQFLTLNKDERLNNHETPRGRALIQDALLLRFSLVGGMFDTIQRGMTLTTDWSLLLVELVTYGVIDLNNNSELFSTVIDMIVTLIHSTLVTDSQSEKGEENRKHYQTLVKKLKKEIGERNSPSIMHVRQLLPLIKVQTEVITTEPIGCLTDTKGNKIQGFDSFDKKQGLQVSEKQKVSAWDLLEGQKNPSPLSWTWFGAVRIERKPLWYEENHRLLKYHTHCLTKPSSYFLDPLPLPPEDLEPPVEKPMMKSVMGPDTPNSGEASPRGTKRGAKTPAGGPSNRKPKKNAAGAAGAPPNKPLTPTHPGMGGPPGMHPGGPMQQQQSGTGPPHMGGYPGNQSTMGVYGQCPPGAPQWSGGYGQQQMNPQQQGPPGGYYPQQMPVNGAAGGPRFDPSLNNQSKRALSQMLRQRTQAPNQFMGGPATQGMQPTPVPGAGGMPPSFQPMQRTPYMRQPIRPPQQMQQQNPMFQNQQAAQQQQQQQQQQQTPYPNMGQQQGMNQSYSGYPNPNQQMMPGGPPPSQQQQQMFPQQGVGGVQGGPGGNQFTMRQQQEYQQQQHAAQQRGRPYLQAPNVTMSGMGGPGPGPAPPYTRPGAPQQQQNPNQQMQMQQMNQQQRIRQQMLQQVMQQQQQQQTQGQQPTPSLVAHLQRQIQNPGQQQQQQNPQQQNPYGMQAPPY